jgi:hypothetical protein
VYLAILAVLAVAGSWATWRRNPLYSTGKTLRMVGGMGLGIAGIVALDILVVNLTMHSPPWVMGTAMGSFILVSVFGMFLIARAFTALREKPLPAGTPMVDLHRRKVYAWAKWAGISIGSLALLGLMLPEGFGLVAYMLSVFCAFIAAFMLPIGYVAARDQDRSLTGVEAEPWVHWNYTEAQWSEITHAEMERAGLLAIPTFQWKKQWKTVVAMAIFMVIFAKFEGYTWGWDFALLAGVVALMAGILWLAKRSARYAPGRKQRAMANSQRAAWFAEGGLFWAGDFSPWISMNIYLVRAGVDESAPRSLVLNFEKVLPGQGGPSIVPVERRILIPVGAEQDVRMLQEKLAEKCPKAAVKICQMA